MRKLDLLVFNYCLKRPSHVKLMLTNAYWQIQIGVCVRHNSMLAWQTVGEKLARIETNSISRQQFANMLLGPSHMAIWFCQHEFANITLTCEGRLRSMCTWGPHQFSRKRKRLKTDECFSMTFISSTDSKVIPTVNRLWSIPKERIW